jgi:hypothetical protein
MQLAHTSAKATDGIQLHLCDVHLRAISSLHSDSAKVSLAHARNS